MSDDRPKSAEWNGFARAALGTNSVVTYLHEKGLLKRWPDPDEMGGACSVNYYSIRKASHDEVMAYFNACLADEDKRMTEQ
jgi:hypothetical protein